MPDDRLRIDGDELTVLRPHGEASGLRGWDAADELLIDQALKSLRVIPDQRVLIIDDQFGALTLGLRRHSPVTVSDSAMLLSALKLNRSELVATGRPASWLSPPTQTFDLAILRMPRQGDYLAWLLRWINQHLSPAGQIIAGGMVKHLPDTSAKIFQDLVDTQTVCPARKKARVIIAKPGTATLDGWADLWLGYPLSSTDWSIDGLPGVFSRRKLDIGTRELMPIVREKAGQLGAGSRVLDLACGNGILGLTALMQRPDLKVSFSDVSSHALLSAKRNIDRAMPQASAEFFHCDGVPAEQAAFDLVMLNPPFHEGGVVGDHIALKLFESSARALAPGGRLLMVGNRHLGYHRTLRRSFKRIRQLAASPKFVVFEADRQGAGRS